MLKRLVDWLGSLVKRVVSESRKPAIGHESTVVFFGGRLEQQASGSLLFRMTGFVSRLDRFGDWVVRRWDDAVPWCGSVWQILKGNLLRYRGNPEQIWCNVRRLGLDEVYAYHPDGVMITAHEKYRSAVSLQDIYRVSQFAWVDRRQVVVDATKFLAESHSRYGYLGEVLPSDIMFGHVVEGSDVADPFWNFPDIVAAAGADSEELAALDLLDFVFSIAFEEYRLHRDFGVMQDTVHDVLSTYGNRHVIVLASYLAQRRQYTQPPLKGGVVSTAMWQHNRARLNPSCDGDELYRIVWAIRDKLFIAAHSS